MTASHCIKDQTLFSPGQPISNLCLIVKGSVLVSFPCGEFTLEKGDILGICEALSSVYQFTYQAQENTSLVYYPFSGIDALESLFCTNTDLASLFCLSAFKQMNFLLRQYNLLELECSSLYGTCTDDYGKYISMCIRHSIIPKNLPLLETLTPFEPDASMDGWITAYYAGLHHLFCTGAAPLFSKEPSAAAGLIGKTGQDFSYLLDLYNTLHEYQSTVHLLYLNTDLEDFFEMYTSLYFKVINNLNDASSIYADITRIITYLQSARCLDKNLVFLRTSEFTKKINSIDTISSHEVGSSGNIDYIKSLNNSLDTILEFACLEREVATEFKNAITAYKNLSDPNATDDNSVAIYKQITDLFYPLYSKIFAKTIDNSVIPMPVKLFLYFGYVDENLAGLENASYLCSLAEAYDNNRPPNVYSLYDWLLAIYNGQKEPSRNQFDSDYTDALHTLKVTGQITAVQEKILLSNPERRVAYELQNMVPTVNKITHGRISSYCPVFSAHQAIKPLSICYVSPASIETSLNRIRLLDFSAFYRETIYTNEAANIPREFFHVECIPDVILMPNIGMRGAMWQEIEGKRRTTPARMMLPIFSLEDANLLLIRLTGEFRWEMCKRIQGARWNDISDHSLTSDYFDYIQYYRKNHELSSEAKEKIKNGLQKAKNSFKEMFVRDYVIWLLYEGTGSPRLNKIARSILFSYCPFSKEARGSLGTNPLYKELLDRYELKSKQRLHHLKVLEQKLLNSNITIPTDLKKEILYTEG